jgi:hypothetical protein
MDMLIHGEPELWLILLIALATLGNLFMTYRLWRLEKSIDETRTHIDLIPQVVWGLRMPAQGPILLRVTSAAPVVATIVGIGILAERADGKRRTEHRFQGGPVTVAPYSSVEMDVCEVMEGVSQELSSADESIPVRFRVVVDHIAYGKRASSASIPYTGLVLEGKLLWSQPVESATAPTRLAWEESGVVP